jgi:sulfate adenylyltransferase
MIPSPHGGKLVNTIVPEQEVESKVREARELTCLKPFTDEIYDAEKIGIGAYSPLEGFMNQDEYESVISYDRLPNGLPWTIPIVLAPRGEDNANAVKRVKEGEDVSLIDWTDTPFAILHVEEKFPNKKEKFAASVYGTTDKNHPNVADIYNSGDTILGGRVTLIRRLDLPAKRFEMTPLETRKYFENMKWRNVTAYQCRNPPHTAHEYIQRCSLEREEIDGIMIQPVVGRLKSGDYKPEIILEAYEALVKNYYAKERVLLCSLSITMRYGGPKAVLFLAIVRKNYGCSHYIVGRDQAGVGNFYDPYACHKIFDKYDIGMQPLKYMETFYCRVCGWMATSKTCPHAPDEHVNTSQTRIRKVLESGGNLPKEILRPEVAKILSKGDVLIKE